MGQWARLVAASAMAGGAVAAIVACSSYGSGGGGGDTTDASSSDAPANPPPGPPDAGPDATCEAPAGDPAFLNDVVAIGAGGFHACALRTNGEVVCWGDERSSQLGEAAVDGGVNMSTRPRKMGPMGKVAQLSVGYSHACAILDGSSEVWCWGDPDLDRLGYVGLGPAPHLIKDGNDLPFKATSVAAGGDFTCAIVSGGSVWCWGGDMFGELGSTYQSGIPALIPIAGGSSAVATGAYHACVLAGPAGAPEVKCWGLAKDGQLGTSGPFDGGTMVTPTTFPTGGVTPLALVVGPYQTCIFDAARKPICSGYTNDGALGPALTQASTIPPVAIPELGAGNLKAFSIAANHSCAIKSDDTIVCMGSNVASLGRGQLDAGDYGPYGPDTVMGVTDPVLSPVAQVATGGSLGPTKPAFSCALVKPACAASGSVVCWGVNDRGQLGDGTTDTRDRPVRVLAPQ